MSDDEVEKQFLGWEEFDASVYSLASDIVAQEDPDVIVGIGRGGLPGAVMMSHAMEADFTSIEASHYEGTNQQATVQTGTIGQEQLGTDDHVLIFDDIVDSGETMKAVEELVKHSTAGMVSTAVIHVKPHRNFEPDYWLDETDDWVVYPWEVSL